MVARWPGSAHDSTIFNQCLQRAKFEDRTYGDFVLLGDSGYGLSRFMMTPFDAPVARGQQLFNESQIRTRNCIERLFGVWKRRFPILALGMRVKVKKAIPIIVACAVLHNILRSQSQEEHLPPDDPNLMLPLPWEELLEEGNIQPGVPPAITQSRLRAGQHIRNNFVSLFYDNL